MFPIILAFALLRGSVVTAQNCPSAIRTDTWVQPSIPGFPLPETAIYSASVVQGDGSNQAVTTYTNAPCYFGNAHWEAAFGKSTFSQTISTTGPQITQIAEQECSLDAAESTGTCNIMSQGRRVIAAQYSFTEVVTVLIHVVGTATADASQATAPPGLSSTGTPPATSSSGTLQGQQKTTTSSGGVAAPTQKSRMGVSAAGVVGLALGLMVL